MEGGGWRERENGGRGEGWREGVKDGGRGMEGEGGWREG